MNKKIASEIAIGIILLVAIIVGGVAWLQNENKVPAQPTAVITQPISPAEQPTAPADEITGDWKVGRVFNAQEEGFSLTLPVGWEKYQVTGTGDIGTRFLSFELPTKDPKFQIGFLPGLSSVFVITYYDKKTWDEMLSDDDCKKDQSDNSCYTEKDIISTNGKWVISGFKVTTEIPTDFKLGKGTGDVEITAEYLKNNIVWFK